MLGIENLFAWVPWLFRWVLSWVPCRGRLGAHERGVKITGHRVSPLGPGTYWWNQRYSTVLKENVRRKVVELDEQPLMTQDLKQVRVGGMLAYKVSDVVKHLVENDDAEHGILVAGAAVIRDHVTTHTLEELQTSRRGTGRDELTRACQADMGQRFGVRIEELAFTSLVQTDCRDLHHSGFVTVYGTGPARQVLLSGQET